MACGMHYLYPYAIDQATEWSAAWVWRRPASRNTYSCAMEPATIRGGGCNRMCPGRPSPRLQLHRRLRLLLLLLRGLPWSELRGRLPPPYHERRPLLAAVHGVTHRSRGPPACSGRPSGPGRRGGEGGEPSPLRCPERGCGGAPVLRFGSAAALCCSRPTARRLHRA